VSVYKRPNGRWAVQLYDPATGRARQVGTYPTRKEAKAAEGTAMASGTASGRETVGSFAARWLSVFPRPKESTNRHNAERVKRFADQHARRRIDSITASEARTWAVQHRSELPALRAMFGDARKLGLVTTNPFSALGLEGPGKRQLRPEWLTAEDVTRLAEVARSTHGEYGSMMAAMVTFAAYTGVRPGELFAVEFGDLDGTTVHIRRAADSKTRTVTSPKNGRARDIVFPRQARDAVAMMPRFHGQTQVFVAPQGGRLWAPHFSWLWSPVRAAFGRPRMHFYELRHFCATHLLSLGLAPWEVAVQLGHTDNGALVMSTYGHPSDIAARARILAALDGHAEGDVAAIRQRREGA
jgi:integrase